MGVDAASRDKGLESPGSSIFQVFKHVATSLFFWLAGTLQLCCRASRATSDDIARVAAGFSETTAIFASASCVAASSKAAPTPKASDASSKAKGV